MRARWQPHGNAPQVWAYGPRRRMDVGVRAFFPAVSRRRLALQIRQDLWRALQDVRGLSPVVAISQASGALEITAGCQLNGAAPRERIAATIAELLTNPDHRHRWIAHAGRHGAHPVPGVTRDLALARSQEAPGQARGAEHLDA